MPCEKKKEKLKFSFKMPIKKPSSFFISLFFIQVFIVFFGSQSGCQKVSPEEARTIKLLPLLNKVNVISSPFKGHPALADQEDAFPVESSPLALTEAGANPYNLKRRLHIGPNYISIIFSPPESRYDLEIDIPPKCSLEFGAGLIFDINYKKKIEQAGSKTEGVEFIIRLKKEEKEWLIFQKFLEMPEEKENRTLNFGFHRLELPSKGGPFHLIFETENGDGAFAFWTNPMIVPQKEEPVGLILISLDTLRADHLSCYGYHRKTSPAMDFLASEGALFLEAISTSSWTLPAHVSLLFSADSVHHGVMAADDRIPENLVALAEILNQNGFVCGAITGGGFVSPKYGFARGFDFYNEAEGSIDFINSAELVFKAARSWLENNLDKDFFLFLHTYQIHSPYHSPEPYGRTFLSPRASFNEINVERYLGGKGGIFRPLSIEERENIIDLYDGEIRYTDEALIDPLIKWLKEKGLFDRMLIILTSDHGEEFYEHGAWVHGAHLYQESIRIPLIIKFPRGLFKGEKIDKIVRITDIAPTILEALNLKKSRPASWDGRSLFPLLRKKEKSDRPFLADTCWLSGEFCGDDRNVLPLTVATNQGQRKIILNRPWTEKLSRIYQPAPASWKSVEIYDLSRDQTEQNDLSSKQPVAIKELLSALQAHYQLLGRLNRLKLILSEEELEKLRALGYIH